MWILKLLHSWQKHSNKSNERETVVSGVSYLQRGGVIAEMSLRKTRHWLRTFHLVKINKFPGSHNLRFAEGTPTLEFYMIHCISYRPSEMLTPDKSAKFPVLFCQRRSSKWKPISAWMLTSKSFSFKVKSYSVQRGQLSWLWCHHFLVNLSFVSPRQVRTSSYRTTKYERKVLQQKKHSVLSLIRLIRAKLSAVDISWGSPVDGDGGHEIGFIFRLSESSKRIFSTLCFSVGGGEFLGEFVCGATCTTERRNKRSAQN